MPETTDAKPEAPMLPGGAAGKIELMAILDSIKEYNGGEYYKQTLQGIFNDFGVLLRATERTNTTIDNGIVKLVLEVVKEKAASDGVFLLK